ncbi:transglutaminase-like domain-containing protein [Albibacterium profundi]|uniref:Transglutaminase-like domain-containing protein n=1 Tax=Albibacterium profundi TaxID=3134906 RepID=A0ABV5CDJ9_9SPHI
MREEEIDSLIRLLDDPDNIVFNHVEAKLLSLGESAIEPLETAWEQSFDPLQQQRIEDIVHKIQFSQILSSLELWAISGSFDLLEGLIIVHKYQYPDGDEQKIINQIEDIKREVWLQMHYSMTPVEKIRLFNNVFYNIEGFSGNIRNYNDPQNSYIGQVLDTRKGNPVLLSCIYSIVAQKLDMPVYGVNLPKHFILAYTDNYQTNYEENEVLFYINAFNKGQVLGKHDVLSFLQQLKLPGKKEFYLPCSNISIIERVLANLLAYYKENSSPKARDIQRMRETLASIQIDRNGL